ncbi:fungal Zn(2)-cys(6) binuclear cluster domain protein, putative [Rhizoctonia solani AG-3 Rhs1AP]|uniref:Fungal Zn(2)-cys(6) binuclear cluster domain protein, putative n=1 Tax=Rhizoctonia solani AG-3 Rhs1AP TaxID=1086054 RepID=X8JB40_9AGAM|nr:fungal Zn(2)-cys(6) binuclear cluster domain protein, putative [Rhizoctonia solani AG-3 Rhs1AP]
MARINRPGPRATSCLTCKKRHQRCDQRIPICERCERGGVECLGYGHTSDTRPRKSSLRTQPTLILPRPPQVGGSGYLSELSTESSSQGELLEAALTSVPSLAVDTNINTSNETHNTPFSNTGCNASPDLWTTNDLALCETKPIPLTGGPMSTFRNLAGLCVQQSRHSFDPFKITLTNPYLDKYLWTQYVKLMEKWYFRPANMHKQTLQCIAHPPQISLTNYSRWIALISLGICEAFMKDDMSQNQLHSVWMKYIEGSLRRELSYHTASRDLESRRRDWVLVSLLRTLVIHSSDVYQVLRSVIPVFLQLAFSNPALWPSGTSLAYVPLMNILNMGSHELAYFALIDCACAMTLGVPQLVEYDTTMYAPPSTTPLHQWAHGSPTEFQLVLAEINACRDKSPAARDWREIERWLLEWQSRPREHTFTESWMRVAWYAVQESWRLALLVYLRLAVCGNASDDPRIQTCVKQLLQVLGTVKERESTNEVPFLVQYLIAGVCARSEAQRKVVFNALKKTKEPKLWIMRGSDFLPVLDHLWHGAAADGRPVNWSDYMRSREALLPVMF